MYIWHAVIGNNPGLYPFSQQFAPPSMNFDKLPQRTHANGPGTSIPGTNGLQFSLPSGIGYVFPKNHVTVNLITSNLQPWENPSGSFQSKSLKVPADMPVSDLIEQLCPERGPDNQKVVSRGIVECIERGGGRWLKGHDFYIGEGRGKNEGMDEKVGKAIKSYGWDQTRNENTMPVWLSSMLVYGWLIDAFLTLQLACFQLLYLSFFLSVCWSCDDFPAQISKTYIYIYI